MVKVLEGNKGLLVVPESKKEKVLLEKKNSQFFKFLEVHMNRLIKESHKNNLAHHSYQTSSVQGV